MPTPTATAAASPPPPLLAAAGAAAAAAAGAAAAVTPAGPRCRRRSAPWQANERPTLQAGLGRSNARPPHTDESKGESIDRHCAHHTLMKAKAKA